MIPVSETYWGREGRPLHILERQNEWRYDSLCGRKGIDVGTPTHYPAETVATVATCRRCLKLWAQDQPGTDR